MLAVVLVIGGVVLTDGGDEGFAFTPLFVIAYAPAGAVLGAMVGFLSTLVAQQFSRKGDVTARFAGAGTAALVTTRLSTNPGSAERRRCISFRSPTDELAPLAGGSAPLATSEIVRG